MNKMAATVVFFSGHLNEPTSLALARKFGSNINKNELVWVMSMYMKEY